MSCLVGTTRAGPLGRRVESTRRTRSHPRARAVVAASRRGEDEGGAHARLAPSRARTRLASRDDASCSRVERSAVDVQYDPAPAPSTSYLRPETLVLSAVVMNAAYATAALAYEGYDGIGVPDDEATPLQNAFGLVFTVFCGWYFLRVVKKRGNRAKEFRVANTLPKEEREARDAEQLAKAKKLTARQAFVGGVTGLGIAFVLYGLTQQIVGAMDGKAVPENYQARQISITVRTIVSGLAYLATFVYAANGTGLVALAAQKWLDKLTGADLIDEAAARWERNEIDGEEEKKE